MQQRNRFFPAYVLVLALPLGCASNSNWGPRSTATVTQSTIETPGKNCRVQSIQAYQTRDGGWMGQLQFVCNEELPLRVVNWEDFGTGPGTRVVAGGPRSSERVLLTIIEWEQPRYGARIKGTAKALDPWSYGDPIEVEFELTLSLGLEEQCVEGELGLAQSIPVEEGQQVGLFCCPTSEPCID